MRSTTLNMFPAQQMQSNNPSSIPTDKSDKNKNKPNSGSGKNDPKTPNQKALRRLAQNRESARRSRLRKKAYIEELEMCRIKLIQLEEDIERSRAQGAMFGGVGAVQGPINAIMNNISTEAAAFRMEYGNWINEHQHRINRLKAAYEHGVDDEHMRIYVQNCITHFDELFHLKNILAQTDVFYIISGIWKSPPEQCLLWIGGFRPTDIINIIPAQIKPHTIAQGVGIGSLKSLLAQEENRLSKYIQDLTQSLVDSVGSDIFKYPISFSNYMSHMAAAINNLSLFQDVVKQADKLRLLAIHRVHGMMTLDQAARSLIAINGYFNRMRSLSSVWAGHGPNA